MNTSLSLEGGDELTGAHIVLAKLFSFLSTLEQSEKPMNQGELEKAVVDYFEGYWPGMETAEQCNTDLRFTPPAIMRLARHFAQWGTERQKEQDDRLADIIYQQGIEKGKDDMNEQMLKEAVEGEVKHVATVHYVLTNEDQLTARLKQFQDGDKVRIIICKKED